MVDIETHRVIDLLNSRELIDVSEWLKSFPNIKIVSRDGSITYNNAISLAHPGAIQISDRFHLLKNLTSYCTDYLKKALTPVVLIPTENPGSNVKLLKESISVANSNRKLTLQEKYFQIAELHSQGKTKTQICKSLNMNVRVYAKLIKATDDERNKLFSTNMIEKSLEKAALKMDLVVKVQKLKQNGYNNLNIARDTGISPKTVRKYLDKDFSPIHGSAGVTRVNMLTPFIKDIDEHLNQGIMGTAIEKVLRNKGYGGSSSTLFHYISNWKKTKKQSYEKMSLDSTNHININTERLERKDIFKLLYHPLDKVKAITQIQFESLGKENPTFRTIHSIVWEFRRILHEKDLSSFDLWISSSKLQGIKEINSFINGLERDITAVKNAIIYKYSNGLAEGSVNKLKVIKRIMYGRCGFETLRIKMLRLEKMRNFN